MKRKTSLMFINLASFLVFYCIISPLNYKLAAENLHIIKNPKPTCEENLYTELMKVGELSETIEYENFLLQPTSMVADKKGNIFVFDRRHVKIFKYDKNLKLIKTFGRKGQGPGEFGMFSRSQADIFLYISKDDFLYVGDRFNLRIHCFDLDGNLIRDVKIRTKGLPFIVPVEDSKKNIYLYSEDMNGGIIDVFNQKGEKTESLLSRKELRYGLFFMPDSSNKELYLYSDPDTIQYDIFEDDKLIVCSLNSGFLYILKDNRLLKKLPLWPKKALAMYKKKLKNAIKDGFIVSYFFRLIPDKDNEKYFYLNFGKPLDSERTLLYKFDLEGRLKEVLFIKEDKNQYTKVLYKKNNLFYAIGTNEEDEKTIILYKEGNKR